MSTSESVYQHTQQIGIIRKEIAPEDRTHINTIWAQQFSLDNENPEKALKIISTKNRVFGVLERPVDNYEEVRATLAQISQEIDGLIYDKDQKEKIINMARNHFVDQILQINLPLYIQILKQRLQGLLPLEAIIDVGFLFQSAALDHLKDDEFIYEIIVPCLKKFEIPKEQKGAATQLISKHYKRVMNYFP